MTPWSADQWRALDRRVSGRALETPSDEAAVREICRGARSVLRAFSSSFFLVTRFLPAAKRAAVDVIYAAVRYPDEIVDSFPAPDAAKHAMLDHWELNYERALSLPDTRACLSAGVPFILAGFVEVVRRSEISADHYRSFLDAMRSDIAPRPFRTVDDLIANYIYGSAIVVGYFLAHVYGPDERATLADAYRCATDLGIALQLTNFARDVAEDQARGRLYVPTDLIGSRGLRGAVVCLLENAEARYERAARSVGVFAPDTRAAIGACIDVYRMLNRRILLAGGCGEVRHSVPMAQKFSALPAGKYWRVPLAYLGGL